MRLLKHANFRHASVANKFVKKCNKNLCTAMGPLWKRIPLLNADVYLDFFADPQRFGQLGRASWCIDMWSMAQANVDWPSFLRVFRNHLLAMRSRWTNFELNFIWSKACPSWKAIPQTSKTNCGYWSDTFKPLFAIETCKEFIWSHAHIYVYIYLFIYLWIYTYSYAYLYIVFWIQKLFYHNHF